MSMCFRVRWLARASSFLLLCIAGVPAFAETHALILTISSYGAGIPPLAGVQRDGENARSIARQMGVADANILELKDQQATLPGLRKAFDELARRVRPNDQVFIYYSGHGGRQTVKDPQERCAESLVMVDGNQFMDSELETRLKILAEKADKVVVFFDACHSGGAFTRGLGDAVKRDPRFAPKFWSKDGSDSCSMPVNRLTRSIRESAKSPGSGAQNYVFIAAAQDNEISLDMADRGGVATVSWMKCMGGAAKDTNRSGAVSVEEIRQCAQDEINLALKDVKGYSAHHLTVVGNRDAVLGFAKSPDAQPVSPPGSEPIKPYNTLVDVLGRRDDRRTVTLQLARPALTIGKDVLDFTLTSSHPGYVYLLMVGSDGQTFDLLFPNRIDRDNYVQAGQAMRLPRSNWEITAQGPAGKDHLLAIVSDAPRDFAALGLKPAGPFSVADATPASAKDIVLVTGTSSNAASQDCAAGPKTRTLAVQRKCSNAYGAAIIAIEEVAPKK
jgi:hypothetical protein